LLRRRSPDEEYAFRNASAELLEFLRVFQEIDDFVKLFLRLINPGYVFERGLLLLRCKQPRAGLSEAQGFISARLHLLHHENPERYQQNHRREIYDESEPVAILHFLNIYEYALVLEGLRYIRDRRICDGHIMEFDSAIAVLALHFGAVLSEINCDFLNIALLDLSQEFCVAGLIFMGRLSAG